MKKSAVVASGKLVRSRGLQVEWELADFQTLDVNLDGKLTSPQFQLGGHSWRLLCYPKQNKPPHEHVSLYLDYPAAAKAYMKQGLKYTFKLSIRNDKNPLQEVSRTATSVFEYGNTDQGFSEMIKVKDVTKESGYLNDDGALVVCLDLNQEAPPALAVPGLSSDFLALLDSPGATSDLTLLAGGRSFPVHRLILAARCPYFKTLFESGFGDSGARELELPDVDPHAVALLLRCIYGDTPFCPERLLMPAAELADQWLLTDTRDALYQRIAATANATTIVRDLLWTEGRGGAEALVGQLGKVFVSLVGEMKQEDTVALEANPRLMTRLLFAVAKSVAASGGARGEGTGASHPSAGKK
ncbi:hypothetical protein GPECTOR_4g872 [Gonium pectorale]|uniref:BTB domain-containing protein n=1 Tax=Gonium pectorale TaxID=33097 RepID=A0A150GY93_GONPE|nr:hypothetical protein GPECTOR_4g872 [Gonium pectorale]|eukprot:KXZ54801.1 hypothetical protein GPECTOR_4g872 [Gonium pectorale]